MSYKKLIILAFEKAGKEELKKGNLDPSKTDKATALSVAIQENKAYGVGEKSLRIYFNKASRAGHNEDIKIPQWEVVNALLSYLGFKDYQCFKESLGNDADLKGKYSYNLNAVVSKNRNKIILAILAVFFIVFVGLFFLKEEQRWMLWKIDHYEKADFSTDLLNSGKLKLYNPERIANFNQLTPDCNLGFFNPDGSVKVWYGKNTAGNLQLFSALGRHPETGKTLKPITVYIIEKYICP